MSPFGHFSAPRRIPLNVARYMGSMFEEDKTCI